MEKVTSSTLSHILSQIEASDKERERKEREKQVLDVTRGVVLTLGFRVLKDKGSQHSSQIGTFAGHGIVGSRLQPVRIFTTPEVEFATNFGPVKLQLEDNVHGDPNYAITYDGIVVKLKYENDRKRTFIITKTGATNWLGEDATEEDLVHALKVLQQIEGVLPDQRPSREPVRYAIPN